jgi:multidrug resistance efflux pump
METLLLLTYFSICWIIFKIFKISVNKWSLTTVILGGVILLGVLLGGMAYFHPATKYARSYFITTQIVPNVRGHVIEVPVKPNVPLKQGDVLVKLDSRPYQDTVDELEAQFAFTKKRLQESRELVRSAGGSMFDVEKYEKDLNVLKSKLDEAKFQLESCVIRAPSDGFVTHVRVRPGQMAVPLPIASLMTFVNTDTATFIAGFHQQPMQNIKAGNEAEILFVGIPGRIFKGHVEHVLTVLAEGELNTGRAMVDLKAMEMPEGLIPAIIKIDDDLSGYFIPMGSDAEVAVYGERWHELSLIRRILLRMQSWKNFLKFH